MAEEINSITTVQGLQRQLTTDILNNLFVFGTLLLSLNIGPDSDFPGLTSVVQRYMHNVGRLAANNGKILSISWVGGNWHTGLNENTTAQLMDLFEAVGQQTNCFSTISFQQSMPLQLFIQLGGISKVAKALRSGGISLNRLDFSLNSWRMPEVSQEAGEKCILDLLNELSQWGNNLNQVRLWKLSIFLNPAFLEKVATVLPNLNLEALVLEFTDPPNYNENDQEFAKGLEDAFCELQNGLESNFSLQEFEVRNCENFDLGPAADPEPHLEALLENLNKVKFTHLLHLNKLGRKDAMSIPLTRHAWSEALPRHADCVADIYYYLHKNIWIFLPEMDFAKETLRLQAELGATRKRHREEMEAKDGEIKRLRAELEAKNKENQLLKAQPKTSHKG